MQAGWQITAADDGAQFNQQTQRAFALSSIIPRDTELVVASLAVASDHPALRLAHSHGVPILRYPEVLGKLSSDFRTLAIGGTHGKSTTTAMLAQILFASGRDPTSVYGAQPIGRGHGGRLGHGDCFAVEACEYRQSFLQLDVEAAAILNIEHDHFDCFPTLESLANTFADFARRIPDGGYLLTPAPSTIAADVAPECSARRETFGIEPEADWRAENLAHERGRFSFDLAYEGLRLGRIQLTVAGHHNVLNAVAAAAMAFYAGCDWRSIADGLEEFAGLQRRLEAVRDDEELTVVDDYAHHPTEISASLETVRQCWPGRRIWCVFQPHQASRTLQLLNGLASSLRNADKVVVADIFRSREAAAAAGDVSAEDLASRLAELGGDVVRVHDQPSIEEHLRRRLRPADVLVTMGAGDIGKIAHGFG
jgi:UDP-N-acetylmuramate--alanine ligase